MEAFFKEAQRFIALTRMEGARMKWSCRGVDEAGDLPKNRKNSYTKGKRYRGRNEKKS